MMKYSFPAIAPALYDRIRLSLIKKFCFLKTRMMCWLWGVKIGEAVNFIGPTILRSHGNEIEIGDFTVFNSLPEANTVGLMNSTVIDTRYGGRVKIGSRCGFSSVVIDSKCNVEIGDRVLVGGNVRIFDHDFHSLSYLDRMSGDDCKNARADAVFIENDVFVGTNAIILKGSRIGARSIIAAGSIVFGLDVPCDSLVKGNPAKIVKRLHDEKVS